MAQALRTVWLEPEEQHEPHAPRLRQRRRRRQTPAVLQRLLVTVVLVAAVVGAAAVIVSGYASIARYEYRRNALQQELVQLNRECTQMNLELDRLAAQPRLTLIAEAQGLELPTADRVHYVRVTHDLPPSLQVTAGLTAPAQSTWLARSKTQMVAAVSDAMQRLRRGPGEPAYAHE